jgi:hypothetical protein
LAAPKKGGLLFVQKGQLSLCAGRLAPARWPLVCIAKSDAAAKAAAEGSSMTTACGAALATFFALAPVLALADERQSWEPPCLSYEEAKAAGEKAAALDPSAKFFDFGDDQARALLKAINAEPPATQIYLGERILVLERLEKDAVEFGIVHDGCFKGPGKITAAVWGDLKRAAFGEGM